MKKHLYSKYGILLTIMRVTFYQLLCIVFLSAMGYAHNTPAQELLNRGVTLNLKEVSLKTALNQIENKAKIRFAYNRDLLPLSSPVTHSFKNEKLSLVLEKLLLPLGIGYQVMGEQILLSKSKANNRGQTRADLPTVTAPEKADLPVKGRVSGSDNNEGLPGVSVVVKGTSAGTITDVNGAFELTVPNDQSILVFSYVGYIPQEIVVNNSSNLNVKLVADTKALEEVVVIGYGTQKKRDLTGAVSSIDNTKNETLPNTNVIQALRGTVPGVSISAGGNAGSGNEISIRGQNSLTANNAALIVVDGIIYSGQLGNLNPNDIASIDVLKDASSAAIFGAKAANGVILITTKKGTTEKPTIQFNSYAGTQNFLMSMDLETPEQYIQKRLNYQKTLAYRGVAPQPNLSNPAQYLNADEIENFENGRTTDAIERISQPAPIQSYNLNIGAKTARTSYYVAGSWTDQQGKVIGDQFKRASLRLNLETSITDWLKFGTNSSFAFVDVSNSPANLNAAFQLSPFARWYLDSAQTILNPIPMTDGLVSNPLLPTLNHLTNQRKDLFGIFYGEVNVPFIPGLSYRFTYSNNIISRKEFNFTPSFNAGGLNRVSSASDMTAESQDMYIENLVKYNRTFGTQHNIDATFLYNYNYAYENVVTASANTFPTDVLTYYSLSLGENQISNASYSDYRAIAMMARINYKFKDRYLLTLTGRRDGASVFSANNKFAFFPSMALGWVISDESFLKNVRAIDFLKVRFSYGVNGNQGINRYQSLSRIEPSTANNYIFGGATAYGIAKTSMGNEDLKWESTYAANLGIDFELLKNRISGNLNFYNSDTKDLLVSRTIPTLNGFSNVLSNLGAVNNKGIEVVVNTVNIRKNDFEWTTSANIARNVNKITKLYGNKDASGREMDDISNGWFIGKSVGAYYNYEVDGVWQIGDEIPTGFRAGDYKLKDLNGDGKISPDADRSIIGYNVPKFTYGISTNFRYKGIGLYVQFSGMAGGMRNNAAIYNPASSFTYRVRDKHINWWTPENPSNEFTSMDYQNSFGIAWLQSTSFLRIQDVSLSYEFGKSILGSLKMSRLQFYVSAKNPVLYSKWGGWDPETTGSGRGQYPTMKSFTAGINLGL